MSEFVLLRGNRVVNRIVSEHPFAQEMVFRGEADAAIQIFGEDLLRVGPGWHYDPASGVFTPPYDLMTLEEAKVQRKLDLAAFRFAAETGGCSANGAQIRTDRESQALLTGAALAAMDDPAYVLHWKAESGWVSLGADQIKSVARAVRAHVQASFDREKSLGEQVDAAETVEAVAAISW